MKKIISHRGNLNGSVPNLENSPDQIISAIQNKLDVEIDVWVVNSEIFLGHDYPQYKIKLRFLKKYKKFLWLHCKNLEALNFFKKQKQNFKYFWHQSDDFTITSNGYFWTYPKKPTSKNSIIVDLSLDQLSKYKNTVFGVCTDYPLKARSTK